MKAGIFNGKKDISVVEVPDPKIQNPDEAIVRVTYSCICGSDLWFYRGINKREVGTRIGHEFMGIVETIGEGVKNLAVGDFVVAPFTTCDGTCPECRVGMSIACRERHGWGSADGYDGGQGQKVRVPTADGTLFVIPKDKAPESMMTKILPLTDVLCTGHHAAVCAGVGPDKVVAVVGDGAVGLCGVAASKRLGAKRIILLSTHPDRATIGKQFGATDIVAARDDEAIAQIKALTDDLGVDCVLESVGTKSSWDTAFGIVRTGGNIGFVGVPNDPELGQLTYRFLFDKNVGIKGGGAPARSYMPELLPDVLSGKLDVSAIFTKTIKLDDLAEGYKAMDERTAIKTLIHPL
jgi:threonine dehydrogenase-like Zn-dependent dehydrogenase